MKAVVYATKPSSSEDLKVKIINVILGITLNQLANVFRELQNRITLSQRRAQSKTKIDENFWWDKFCLYQLMHSFPSKPVRFVTFQHLIL